MKKLTLLISFIVCISCSVAASGSEYLKVAILGTGKPFGEPEELNEEAFAKLLAKIKEEKPDLVFFTGYLMMGLEASTSAESLLELQVHFQTFSRLVKTYLGDEIPLYPVLGNHSLVNSQAVKIFRDHLKINQSAPLEPYQLAYSVVADNVKFTVLATGDYERMFRGYRSYTRSMPILDWLEKELRTEENGLNFHFVINHEPAFSTGESEGMFFGIDRNSKRRDMLWNILKRNDVRGYLCSHELIYDRSNRGGVWQVISGGIGEPSKAAAKQDIFEHYVLLVIPKEGKENPIAKAIDLNGKVWDEFEMMHIDRPVHHLRISQNTLD